jgi:hypothetical protein
MKKIKSILFYLVATLFTIHVLYFSFFQSSIPGATEKAIPCEATFVHSMKNIDELLKSPVCGQINKKLGTEITLAKLLKEEPWLKDFMPSEITIANMPLHYRGQSKTWAMVSWVGWRSPWLRWKLEGKKNKHFTLLKKYHVWSVWEYKSNKIAPNSSLTFSLTDTLFIVCISDHPSDIFSFLNSYDGLQASIASIKTDNEKTP